MDNDNLNFCLLCALYGHFALTEESKVTPSTVYTHCMELFDSKFALSSHFSLSLTHTHTYTHTSHRVSLLFYLLNYSVISKKSIFSFYKKNIAQFLNTIRKIELPCDPLSLSLNGETTGDYCLLNIIY